ncbi:protein BTG1-like [Petromyzon marinus]|uniref:Protein BTG1 n=1 Tax=Petromyzon marinus TaxID=7757 RepID=A0AAJ7X317_PETMA|nr:protein BTG1-like [Petromyzon marinus]
MRLRASGDDEDDVETTTMTTMMMKLEIESAVSFLRDLLRGAGVRDGQLQTFSQALGELLAERYQHHWFPDKPCKGSGYRCIRINHKMDPLLGQAATRIGLDKLQLFRLLPSELTLWIDPFEVSYRIGEDGSICVLYEAEPHAFHPAATPILEAPHGLGLLGRSSPPRGYAMMTVSG